MHICIRVNTNKWIGIRLRFVEVKLASQIFPSKPIQILFSPVLRLKNVAHHHIEDFKTLELSKSLFLSLYIEGASNVSARHGEYDP
jgi:hypothetical protein